MNDLLTMFDPQPGLNAHRAHAAGCRYTLPDYPVPGGVPIRADGGRDGYCIATPKRGTRRAEAMAALAAAPDGLTVPALAAALDEHGSPGRRHAWSLLMSLVRTGHARRNGRHEPCPTGLMPVFEIVPDGEAA